jgi:hypothetical protein
MMRRMTHVCWVRFTIAALAIVTISMSCGGGTEPRNEGRYDARITGAVTATAQGVAGLATFNDQWGVLMAPRGFGDGWAIFLSGPGRPPAAGTTLAVRLFDGNDQTPDITGDVTRSRGENSDFWALTGGQLRIVSSSDSRLSGTFELSAEPAFPDGPGTIGLSGSFDAIDVGTRPLLGIAASYGITRRGSGRSLVNR